MRSTRSSGRCRNRDSRSTAGNRRDPNKLEQAMASGVGRGRERRRHIRRIRDRAHRLARGPRRLWLWRRPEAIADKLRPGW